MIRKFIEDTRKTIDDTFDDIKKRTLFKERVDNVVTTLSSVREKFLDSAENLGIDLRTRQDVYLKDFNSLLDVLGLEPPYPSFETYTDQSFSFLRIFLDLPGFKKEDIELECAPKKIRVKGVVNISNKSIREVNKIINLPEIVNPQSAKANLEHGILKVELVIVK